MTSAACSIAKSRRKVATSTPLIGDARDRYSASQLHFGVAQHYRRDAEHIVVVFHENPTIHVIRRHGQRTRGHRRQPSRKRSIYVVAARFARTAAAVSPSGVPWVRKLSYNRGMDEIERTIARIEASARLEGIEIDEQTRDLMRRNARGEITIDEAIEELDRRFKRKHR